ncbi:MAG: stage V sporulation protein G [Rhodopirellula sp.]|nr:stage V sporulation protein G [Rhodopirellula sp.]
MEITEIRIKLMERSEDRLRGFCSITIENAFVIRDLKIIDGTNGPFVAMPSRKLSSNCQRCRHKNHLRSNYCNHCGTKLQQDDVEYAAPQKLYADVAHPINSECREEIQQAVLAELAAELSRCEQPGYRSRYDDDFDTDENESMIREPRTTDPAAPSSPDVNSDVTRGGTSTREGVTPTAQKKQTTPAASDQSNTHTSQFDPQTTIRVDNQKSDAVPAPMQSQKSGPTKKSGPTRRKAAATPQPDDNDNFGAGIF